jgi:hypothetical protein
MSFIFRADSELCFFQLSDGLRDGGAIYNCATLQNKTWIVFALLLLPVSAFATSIVIVRAAGFVLIGS